ncbi:hypothetical protein BN2476_590014 [Paraburkholderia piptadeniae]|uniref:Uncharacterized protein n=2 Tax=Paraburkholderia TaxID=1822464 RepID=A0A1N7SRF1_9BURK|nr:hypothetical protein BN2476_590014 [Paraburkholderia piptadeniae]SIT49899.1 hypothetical protein BN2475_2050002 [Paraburkholderia ribeironis]
MCPRSDRCRNNRYGWIDRRPHSPPCVRSHENRGAPGRPASTLQCTSAVANSAERLKSAWPLFDAQGAWAEHRFLKLVIRVFTVCAAIAFTRACERRIALACLRMDALRREGK